MTARQVRIISVMAIGMVFWGTSVSAQMPEPQGTSSAQKKNVPHFENFPVVEEFHGKHAQVDLSSHPLARTFRTRLRDGAKKRPNFAGHYALVWYGCGNECQGSLIIDLRTGKVYGLIEPSSESSSGHTVRLKKEMLQSSRGIDFRLTSKLLIVDPPCPKDYNPCVSFGNSEEPVRYYIMG